MGQSAKIFAKKLLILSLENNRVNEEKVIAILQTLKANPPRNYKKILEMYFLKIHSEIRKENATIEYAGALLESQINDIKHNLDKYYNRDIKVTTVNVPELLAGVRVSVADDVWDTSALGRLEMLAQSFK